jgi:hypothetical protein
MARLERLELPTRCLEGSCSIRTELQARSRLPNQSGRPDLNRRPPAPKAGALAGLRYSPKCFLIASDRRSLTFSDWECRKQFPNLFGSLILHFLGKKRNYLRFNPFSIVALSIFTCIGLPWGQREGFLVFASSSIK